MPGTREGGLKARETNLKRYGKDYYVGLGKAGGAASRGGGFARNPELASRAGKIGGARSKRKSRKSIEEYRLSYEEVQ